jgi:septum formation protein
MILAMRAVPPIVLASSSLWRRALLERLLPEFEAVSPDLDESALADESPYRQVRRLAEAKARHVASQRPDAIVIGSDQVALLNGTVLGKPGTRARAVEQLRLMGGARVRFMTGICMLAPDPAPEQIDVVDCVVVFRAYSDTEIERYLDAEQPLGCAGSFRSEGLGISLVERFDGDDPTALIGLPLIRLSAMLRNAGIDIP